MNRLAYLANLRSRLEKLTDPAEAAAEAKLVLSEVLACSVSDLYVQGEQPVPAAAAQRIEAVLSRREAGEPVAYALGRRWFMGLPFYVDARVLIPRRETELLAETAVLALQKWPHARLLDVCTGSGCVAVAAAKLGGAQVDAADIDAGALAVAAKNAADNGVEIRCIQSDLFAAIDGVYDVVTANPPYIAQSEYEGLDDMVRLFEPALALTDGGDGLAFYRRIARAAGAHLRPGGLLLLEIGCGQGAAVQALLRAAGFAGVACLQDMERRDRVVTARKA